MNDLKDLVIAVDGYSFDKTGFEITEAHKGKGDYWSLSVKAYKKEDKDRTCESKVSILSIIDRIESKYNIHSYEWAVVKAEELAPGSFELLVKKVTDEKEDSSDKEEQYLAEKHLQEQGV